MRHIILLILACLVVVFWTSGVAQGLNVVHGAYEYLDSLLKVSIGGYEMGESIRMLLVLVLVPLLVSLLVRIVYWLLRRPTSALIPGAAWGVWLVLVTMIVTKSA